MQFSAKIKEWFGVQDLTVGKPMTGLVRFSVPLLIGNLAQQLYNTVDSVIVGNYIGDGALAAVGTAGPILNLLLVLFMGISVGASIMAAQYFGAKDRENLSHVVGSSIFLTVASGLLMTVLGLLLTPTLVRLIVPQETIAADTMIYLRIIFIGMLGGAAYNILAGVLRGIGDSVSPLLYLVIASLLNIVLDILFVTQFGMTIDGVAWATIIAQALSGLLCVIRLCRMKDVVDVNRRTLRPHPQLVGKLCRLGLPAGVTQAIFSLSAIIVQGLTNSMGEVVMAASVAVMRVDGFAMMPNFTFGTAATTYVGQNTGAGRAERIRPGVMAMLKLAVGTALVLVACILLFGHGLIGLFTKTEAVMQVGQRGLRWLAFGYLCFAVTQVLQGVMRGAGETMIPMWIGIVTTVVERMPLAYLLAYLTRSDEFVNGHPDAIFASLLVAWVTATVVSLLVYRSGRWKRRLPREFAEAVEKTDWRG